MKKASILLTAVLAVMLSIPATAKIRSEDLDRKVMVTERQQLMSQVDTVSLYLSSDRVGYEPELTHYQKIKVTITVLCEDMMLDKDYLQDFISRQIRVFKRELTRRLSQTAPAVAASFNADTDLIFFINEGGNRQPVAEVSYGSWTWFNKKGSAEPAAQSRTAKRSSDNMSEARGYSCNCPALVGRK